MIAPLGRFRSWLSNVAGPRNLLSMMERRDQQGLQVNPLLVILVAD